MKRAVLFVIFLAVMCGVAAVGFCQDATLKVPDPTVLEPEMQWLWGEVVSVDPSKNVLVVKYLDYEADAEKEMSLSVDEKTTFENSKSLDEIKPQDTVSIDYMSAGEGKVLAKNISVEKPEPVAPVMDEPLKEEAAAVEAAAPEAPEAAPAAQ